MGKNGLTSAEFYRQLLQQVVLVAVAGGVKFKGELVGVDQYDIFIRQDTGLTLLLNKGNIIYVHAASGSER